MKKFVVIGLLIVVTGVLMIGCGDDECPSCPEPFAQAAVVVGNASLGSDEFRVFTYVFAADGGATPIDSAKVEGAHMEVASGYEGFQYTICMFEDTLSTLHSGDSITVQIFAPGGTSSAHLKILDRDLDAPTNFNHPESSPYDTIPIGTGFTVTWDDVPAADWYGIYYNYRYDSNGTHAEITHAVIQTTTSITIPASEVLFDGYFNIGVSASAGPNPETSSGNVTGGVLRGAITSTAYEGLNIYVGTGDAYPSSIQPVPPEEGPTFFEYQISQLR